MSRPVIGITTSFNEGEQRLNHLYVLAVEQAGGLPLIVPMCETDGARMALVRILDGLIISGGPAVTDRLIGALPDDISETDPVRVESDRAIVEFFLRSRQPMLGICYGMQLLNAVQGGSIYADFQAQTKGSTQHSEKRGGGDHSAQASHNSRLGELLGTKPISVNSKHIQAVAEIGEDLRATMRAADGCVEGIEGEGPLEGLVLGVQFHPERMGAAMQPLFEALVERARKKDKAD